MRLRLFILLAAVVAILTAQGQDHYEGTLAVGGKMGATLSKVNFNPSVQQSMSPGMTAGVMFRYIEEKNFGLIAELNVTQRGWKEAFDDVDYNYCHRFTYLELPIMTHIFFGSERVKGFFNLGPELNVMIADGVSSNFDYRNAASMEYFITDARHIEQLTMDVKNKLDYGISVGAGMELNLNKRSSMLLEGRFYYGLTDVFPNHKTDIFSGSNSMSIMLSLGYFYRLK
ncbi:MAG: PorT family protein [Muribaculaceae bacterium]|nr:PorT family protein [Muribaculaceae bacterium]